MSGCFLTLSFRWCIDGAFFLLGTDDGYVARKSFFQLIHESSSADDPTTPTAASTRERYDALATRAKNLLVRSDIPLAGTIVSLHLVKNNATGEEMIVGGADDGSVGIWELK